MHVHMHLYLHPWLVHKRVWKGRITSTDLLHSGLRTEYYVPTKQNTSSLFSQALANNDGLSQQERGRDTFRCPYSVAESDYTRQANIIKHDRDFTTSLLPLQLIVSLLIRTVAVGLSTELSLEPCLE